VSIHKTRGFLYWLARTLGDVQAVKTGRIGRRVGRRVAGKSTGRLMRKLFTGSPYSTEVRFSLQVRRRKLLKLS